MQLLSDSPSPPSRGGKKEGKSKAVWIRIRRIYLNSTQRENNRNNNDKESDI